MRVRAAHIGTGCPLSRSALASRSHARVYKYIVNFAARSPSFSLACAVQHAASSSFFPRGRAAPLARLHARLLSI